MGLPALRREVVSRNLWHACGQFTLEALFSKAKPAAVDLARQYVGMLHSLGDVQVIPQKTRLVCVARVRFAGLSPRKDGFLASFALHRWLDSPRIVKTADYGPRWRGHHVLVRSQTDLDDELCFWLQEAHDVVGLQADLGRTKKYPPLTYRSWRHRITKVQDADEGRQRRSSLSAEFNPGLRTSAPIPQLAC